MKDRTRAVGSAPDPVARASKVWRPSLLLAGALATGFFGTGVCEAVEARDVEKIRREISLLVQGDPVAVTASPVLCQPGSAPTGAYAENAEEWYFGKDGCRLTYAPRPSATVTTASEAGWKEWFFTRPGAPEKLVALLAELAEALRENTPLHERLAAQSTVWEIVYGLKHRGKGDTELVARIEPVLGAAFRVLERSLFSAEDLGRLPATLPTLPERAGAPEIAPLVQRILQHDPGVVEVWTPTELHADLLFGRFAVRLFLTVDAKKDRARFRNYLSDPATPYDSLHNLPLEFSGLRAVLVLYFNVLGTDFTILPTEMVAFWQEYSFSGKTSFDLSLTEMVRRISFTSIRCEWPEANGSMAGQVPEQVSAKQREGVANAKAPQTTPHPLPCRKVPSDAMARRSFLDVRPILDDDRVTSLRGHCLRCHRNQVSTFDTHGRRGVEFSRPLARSGRDVLTPHYLEDVEPKLRQWAKHFVGSRKPASTPAAR